MKSIVFFIVVLLAVMNASTQSLLFDGSTNYVQLGNVSPLQLTAFTLEAWIRPAGAGKTANTGLGGVDAFPIVTKGRGEDDSPSNLNMNYFLGLRSDYKLVADFEESAGRNRPVNGKSVIPLNTWTHVAVTYDPESAIWRMYVNGVQDTAIDLGSNIYPANGSIQPAAIASALNSKSVAQGFFYGRIDEVRIWSIVRSATAIRDNYKKQLSGGTGLVARYALNELSGNVAPNSITTTGNGTLISNPKWINGFNNSAPFVATDESPADSSNISSASTSLGVTVNDANNDRLKVNFYARRKVTGSIFSMVLIPDTQFYTAEPQGTNGGNNSLFKSQTNWIARNRSARNIVYAGHLGDCVQNADKYEQEWKRADTAMRIIESPGSTGLTNGLPYGICVGNHDQMPFGDPKGTTTFYNKYFGVARFSGRPYYGGHCGTNNDNHFQLVNAGGIEFLILCPEYDQTQGFAASGGTLDWMESVVKEYPSHKIIVLSHFVLTIDSKFTAQGGAIFNRLKQYPGFILMMGGHVTQGEGESRRTDTYNGRTIHTLSSDYQTRTKGGNGMLRILTFDPKANSMSVQTYSSYTDSYETDTSSQFVLPVDLNVSAKPFTLAGSVTGITRGTTASITFPVEQNAAYEWYVSVNDGERTSKSPVWNFTANYTAASATVSSSLAWNGLPDIEQKVTDELIVNPNPTHTGFINFALTTGTHKEARVLIYNEHGALVQTAICTLNHNKGSLAHRLAKGVYIIVVTTNRNRLTKRIVVQ